MLKLNRKIRGEILLVITIRWEHKIKMLFKRQGVRMWVRFDREQCQLADWILLPESMAARSQGLRPISSGIAGSNAAGGMEVSLL